MKKKGVTKCPCCKRNISYIEALTIKNKDSYVCPKCEEEFEIKYKVNIKKMMTWTILVSFIICIVSLIMGSRMSILFLFLTLIPFVIFYLYIPKKIYLNSKPTEDIQTTKETEVSVE